MKTGVRRDMATRIASRTEISQIMSMKVIVKKELQIFPSFASVHLFLDARIYIVFVTMIILCYFNLI